MARSLKEQRHDILSRFFGDVQNNLQPAEGNFKALVWKDRKH